MVEVEHGEWFEYSTNCIPNTFDAVQIGPTTIVIVIMPIIII